MNTNVKRKKTAAYCLIREAKSRKRELHGLEWWTVSPECLYEKGHKTTEDFYSSLLDPQWYHNFLCIGARTCRRDRPRCSRVGPRRTARRRERAVSLWDGIRKREIVKRRGQAARGGFRKVVGEVFRDATSSRGRYGQSGAKPADERRCARIQG